MVVSVGLGLIAWRPPTFWVATIAAPNLQSGVTAMASASDGLYASGFAGPSNASPGYLFVTKYDSDGGQVWSQKFGNASTSIVNAISIAQDGVYMTVNSSPSSFVLKYDLNGNQIWNDSFGGFNRRPTSIATRSGEIYVGGYGAYPSGGFLREYDSGGNLIWTRLLDNSTTGPLFLYVDSDGIFISGSNTGSAAYSGTQVAVVRKYDTQGNLSWNQTLSCDCNPTGVSGDISGIYVVGQARGALPGQVWSGSTDTFIRKYDFNGNSLWTSEFGSPDYTTSISPQISAVRSGVYLTVDTGGSSGGFVMKYDGNGRQEWSVEMQRVVSAVMPIPFPTVLSAGTGAVYLGGSRPSPDAFIAAMSTSSSLVIFGINPPGSFLVVGSLAIAAAASVIWYRLGRKRTRRPKSAGMNRPGKLLADALARSVLRFSRRKRSFSLEPTVS